MHRIVLSRERLCNIHAEPFPEWRVRPTRTPRRDAPQGDRCVEIIPGTPPRRATSDMAGERDPQPPPRLVQPFTRLPARVARSRPSRLASIHGGSPAGEDARIFYRNKPAGGWIGPASISQEDRKVEIRGRSTSGAGDNSSFPRGAWERGSGDRATLLGPQTSDLDHAILLVDFKGRLASAMRHPADAPREATTPRTPSPAASPGAPSWP